MVIKYDFWKGRHDACVVPRAVPIVESMMSLCLLDYYLLNKKLIWKIWLYIGK